MGLMTEPMNTPHSNEVHNVKTIHSAHNISKSVVSLVALLACFLPVTVLAATQADQAAHDGLLNVEAKQVAEVDAEALYDRLQDQSREVCGPTELRMTGGLKRSRNNENCYQGTLTAAVQRLDHPEVTELHIQ